MSEITNGFDEATKPQPQDGAKIINIAQSWAAAEKTSNRKFVKTIIRRKRDGTITFSVASDQDWIPAQPGTYKVGPIFNPAMKHLIASLKNNEMSFEAWYIAATDMIHDAYFMLAGFEGGTEWSEGETIVQATALAAPKLKLLESLVQRVESKEIRINSREFWGEAGRLAKF
jgi:hypothetical protein